MTFKNSKYWFKQYLLLIFRRKKNTIFIIQNNKVDL